MSVRTLLLSLFSLSLTLAPRPAIADADGGRFRLRLDESTGVVEVIGLDASERGRLASRERPPEQWAALLSVRMARGPGEQEAAPIVGRHEVVGETLRFTPRYPFIAGPRYVIRFDPRRLEPAASSAEPVETSFSRPKPAAGKPTGVVAIFPTADLLPENQLKFYLYFSAPMARGEAYRRVRLLDGADRSVERPFLELDEELWNAEMTRLTLLFDPGRIKRGLRPREEEGPILEAGKSYTFVIDREWPDASGRPLAAETRKPFRAGPADDVQPKVNRWSFDVPAIGSRDPLVVRFPESLDRAMLDRVFGVRAGGNRVIGRAEIGERERSWRYVPDAPWPDAAITIGVDPELEDLAGNSLARPFEVGAGDVRPGRTEKGEIVVPIPRSR